LAISGLQKIKASPNLSVARLLFGFAIATVSASFGFSRQNKFIAALNKGYEAYHSFYQNAAVNNTGASFKYDNLSKTFYNVEPKIVSTGSKAVQQSQTNLSDTSHNIKVFQQEKVTKWLSDPENLAIAINTLDKLVQIIPFLDP
jgi:hypothetical protein